MGGEFPVRVRVGVRARALGRNLPILLLDPGHNVVEVLDHLAREGGSGCNRDEGMA